MVRDPVDCNIDHAADRAQEQAQEIDTILARGRQARAPLPRGLWIASGIIGAICTAGFAIAMLDDSRPSRPARELRAAQPAIDGGPGFVAGLAIGGIAGLAVGAALARQRRDHSSRRRP